jgi:DNA-binding transcriptional LysR family regulator
VRVELRQLPSAAQLGAVRAGDLDLALVHLPPDRRDLEALRVLEQPYVLASRGRAGWRAARSRPPRSSISRGSRS